MAAPGTVEIIVNMPNYTITRTWSAAGYADTFAWKPGAEPGTEINRRTVIDQAAAALQANRTYVALASPTNAQNLAQIRALSRQMNGLIRHLLGDFSGSD